MTASYQATVLDGHYRHFLCCFEIWFQTMKIRVWIKYGWLDSAGDLSWCLTVDAFASVHVSYLSLFARERAEIP